MRLVSNGGVNVNASEASEHDNCSKKRAQKMNNRLPLMLCGTIVVEVFTMQISVPITQSGLLPDKYGKFAPAADMLDGDPVRSFPITITKAPADTQTFALELIDDDAIPVAGFTWIHWSAANIPATLTEIPEDASRELADQFVQGRNSNASKFVGSTNLNVYQRYTGPVPPDKTHIYTLKVYAVDTTLDLQNGFWLNALKHALEGHVLATSEIELPSRAE
jgi:Raf kinase inhibitor-like YbhB/YbcL family protein